MLTDEGEVPLAVPRDRNGTFDTAIVPQGTRRLGGFDAGVLSLYARGLTVREIRRHLEELYGVSVSPDLISRVTDALRVKIRDEGLVRNKAVYLALAITCQGEKEVLGRWIEQTEGAKFWFKVMNELHARALARRSTPARARRGSPPDRSTARGPRARPGRSAPANPRGSRRQRARLQPFAADLRSGRWLADTVVRRRQGRACARSDHMAGDSESHYCLREGNTGNGTREDMMENQAGDRSTRSIWRDLHRRVAGN